MAKKRLSIAPKLKEEEKEVQPLPIQKISVQDIEEMAQGKVPSEEIKDVSVRKTPAQKSKKKKVSSKQRQGRPRREERVRRLSSDLPEDLYLKVKKEVKDNGYTLNGFLAKVIKEYFDRKER